MPKFEYSTLEELQQEIRKGELNEDLLDWESNAKISEWLAQQPQKAQSATTLYEAYRKAQNEREQLQAILTALSFSKSEIENLLEGVSIELFQPILPTLEELSKQMNTLADKTKYLDNFKAVIGTISLLPEQGIPNSSGWIPCEGQLLSIQHFEVLFVRLGTSHGGDGKNYFALPNLSTQSLCRNYRYYIFTGVFGDIPLKAIWVKKDLQFSVNSITFTMILVEGGVFIRENKKVTLSSYYIGQFQVTQALWKAVMQNNPSEFIGNNHPVECVSYDTCIIFIRKLNDLTGKHFRLPTEGEWEFAARGGTQSKGYKFSGSNNIEEVAWYEDNSKNTTHPVGQKKANELGIYDMSGNVWECCQDWYGNYSLDNQTNPTGFASGGFRVIRGGSWYSIPSGCTSAYRSNCLPANSHNFLGLRLALVLQ